MIEPTVGVAFGLLYKGRTRKSRSSEVKGMGEFAMGKGIGEKDKAVWG
jgi:hypothetical protein